MTDRRGATAGDPVVLSVSGVDKRFPGVHALKQVSFDCRSGEIHGLVGENGAGKSTLMRVLSGVHRPDAGSIRVRGHEVEFAVAVEVGHGQCARPGAGADNRWRLKGGIAVSQKNAAVAAQSAGPSS